MNKLLCINNLTINPYQNLALEEYLLKSCKDDIFMLWQNEPAIVVGKHQNTLAEINLSFAQQNNIKVTRRLSGGGAVFHDLGNLNFTFIINGSEGKMVDFSKYTNDIVDILNELGVPVISNKRHDLTIHGKKISGNAEHIFKSRVLHHGTLLFDSDLAMLDKAITPSTGKYIDKSVQSIRSRVCNIFPYLLNPINMEQFKFIILEGMNKKYPDSLTKELNSEEIDEVRLLSEEKYSTWEWIFAYSPKYSIENQLITLEGCLNINLVVKKGIILESYISGDLFGEVIINQINNALIGMKHQKDVILEFVKKNIRFNLIKKNLIQEFVNKLF